MIVEIVEGDAHVFGGVYFETEGGEPDDANGVWGPLIWWLLRGGVSGV
jgi:hypothetical protein